MGDGGVEGQFCSFELSDLEQFSPFLVLSSKKYSCCFYGPTLLTYNIADWRTISADTRHIGIELPPTNLYYTPSAQYAASGVQGVAAPRRGRRRQRHFTSC